MHRAGGQSVLRRAPAADAGGPGRRPAGAVWLNDEGRRVFLSAWQKRLAEPITHPYLKEKLAWGLVPYVQALLLARYLRGDLDGYPPFLWK